MDQKTELKSEMKKKPDGCATIIVITLIALVCLFVFTPANLPTYVVRLAKIGSNNNANLQIVIPNNITDSQMKEIAKTEAKRYTNQRYVFVFFYTNDRYDCYATSHSQDDYEVKHIFQSR